MVMSHSGFETKNNCAGEGQQQFSSQSGKVIVVASDLFGNI
jgi:hypothetical protein